MNNNSVIQDGCKKEYAIPTCVEDLWWYHGGLNRNTSEALLLSNSEEGTYLIRDSKSTQYAISVRCHNSVRHFGISHDKAYDSYTFGVYTFYSFDELNHHFLQKPILGNGVEDGGTVILRYPYPNDIYEPSTYMEVTRQCELQGATPVVQDFHVGSKEGYLTKRGGRVKNWKKRWFAVQKDELKYFSEKKARKPKRIWDLKLLVGVEETGIDNKENCFCLVFPSRTLYCYASSPKEVKDWIDFFQWKIDHFKEMKLKTLSKS